MNSLALFLFAFIVSTLSLLQCSLAFAPTLSSGRPPVMAIAHSTKFALAATSSSGEDNKTEALTAKEKQVYTMLEELSESNLPFRIVVVGNGAILESTNTLGPTFKLGKSPKSVAHIVTFASEELVVDIPPVASTVFCLCRVRH